MYNPAEYGGRGRPRSQDEGRPRSQEGPQNYHCRGYLPHLELKPLQVVTFRLADSVPREVIDQWKCEMERQGTQSEEMKVRLRKLIDQYEDAGYGHCYLKDERIAKLVEDTLFFYDGTHYRLVRWCIMPNHVHVMIEPMESFTLSTILKEWKSYTSHVAKKMLGIKEPFWMQEYYDRYVRDMNHYNNAVEYIDNNPVRAGLAEEPPLWRWSSAYWESI